jgi:hypothetical protein
MCSGVHVRVGGPRRRSHSKHGLESCVLTKIVKSWMVFHSVPKGSVRVGGVRSDVGDAASDATQIRRLGVVVSLVSSVRGVLKTL